MSLLHRLDRGLAWLERALVVLLLLTLLLLGFLQVILRNVFASGLFWADDVLRHQVLWLGFLGASLATREQRHLRMDVLAQWLPSRCQARLNLLASLLAVVGCVLLAHAAWTFVYDEYMAGMRLSVGLRSWVAQSILPLGFALMALRFAFCALTTLGQLRKDQM